MNQNESNLNQTKFMKIIPKKTLKVNAQDRLKKYTKKYVCQNEVNTLKIVYILSNPLF